jgi:hypothetical protein
VLEDREYRSSIDHDKPRGRRIFKDCQRGCPVQEEFEALGNAAMKNNACAECKLKPGPDPLASLAMKAAGVPQSAVDWSAAPHWLASAVEVWRSATRSPF